MSRDVEDPEHEIKFGHHRAVVGAFGASLRRYYLEHDGAEWDVIWGYRGRPNKIAGQGDVLMPFPSRLKNGRYAFAGQTHQLDLTDKEGPNAIHGFLRAEMWQTRAVDDARVQFAVQIRPDQFKGYPFALDLTVEYALSAGGLRTTFGVRNVGAGPAPFGAGFHPYFSVDDGAIDGWIASFPASEYLEFKDLVPTGQILSVDQTPLDYRSPRPVGANRFNFCFQNLRRGEDGYAHATLSRADQTRRIDLRFDRSFNYLVVYSGEAIPAPYTRRAFAIEPLTCATDAFNHPDWGLKILAAGEDFGGHYEVEATP